MCRCSRQREYTLTSTGEKTAGWMGMSVFSPVSIVGFLEVSEAKCLTRPWGNSDGSFTLSQRQASGEVIPTTVSSPPRVATLSTTLSTANSDTTQNLIWAFGTDNPGSSSESAILQQHLDAGTLQLDLTKSLLTSTSASSTGSSGKNGSSGGKNGSSGDIPLTPYQRMVIAHAIVCVVGFALLLPTGPLPADLHSDVVHWPLDRAVWNSWTHDYRQSRARIPG
ncbi:hypothetical protein C8R44DRAFT_786091 [Mycena epipterygia]|nr:hypothetical protein C8R44DRAFT_786091 [Mycena epipterygia]